MLISLVLDWFYTSKTISLAIFWMVFKSSVLFFLRSPKSAKTPKSDRKQVPASWVARKENIFCENAKERQPLCSRGGESSVCDGDAIRLKPHHQPSYI